MKPMRNPSRRGNPIVLVIILILVPVFILSGLQFLESTGLFDRGQEPPIKTKTIIRDGKAYYPRQDITVILLAGIDESGKAEASGSYNNPGEADMVTLLVFDNTNKKLDVIALNRDTMLEIPVIGVTGQNAGTKTAQLALAHTYGSGMKDSAKNLSKTVSTYLYDLQINYYVTLRMDAIAILNDAVGGVEVEITEDFSAIDPSMTGKVRLTGEQAQIYLQTRRGLGDELNLSRMQRQEKYMRAFVAALKARSEISAEFAVDLFEQVSAYMVTDCTAKTISSFSQRFADYAMGDIVTFEGTNVAEEYMEFHVTEQQKDKVVLKYLYALKD